MKGGREGGRKKEKTQRNKVESKLTMSFPIQVTSLFLFLFLFLLLLLLLVFMFVPFLLCPLTQRNTRAIHIMLLTHTHERQIERDCCQECGNLEIKIVLGLWKWEEAHNDDESRQREKILHNLGFANRQRAPQKPQQ
jgi:hypothetical protein